MAKNDGGALAGLKVVDLTRILAGPFCTQMLGDHGAEIIKVEPPHGDDTRTWGPPFKDDQSAYFAGVNRNKKSISLDLSKAPGQEILFKMLEDADVLIENFKAGQMEKWNIGYEQTIKQKFPSLIYCRITGFGADGPFGGMPGYDAIAQVMSGLVSVNGAADGPPFRLGVPVSDLCTGLYASNAILMALAERAQSGEGQQVDVSLLACSISLLHPHGANYLMSGKRPRRTGNAHPNIAPYELFETKNGSLFIAGGNDRQFAALCRELGHPEIADDPRFATNAGRVENRDTLSERLSELLGDQDGIALAESLLSKGIPAGPVLDIPEALDHPQSQHMEMSYEMDGFKGIGVPVKMSRTPGRPRSNPPVFAADSQSVLRDHGYSEADIQDLLEQGIINVVSDISEAAE